MNLRRSLVVGSAVLAVLGSTVTAAVGSVPSGLDDPTREPTRHPTITWKSCPNYSDEVLEYMGVPASEIPKFREVWARVDCGTLEVPLSYSERDSRPITIAVTRLKATDQANRLGSVALNPGGPGGSGYLMPVELVLPGTDTAKLNERYDLIGFDPRGIGYSTSVDCERGDGPMPSGTVTEADARKAYAQQVKTNLLCAISNPTFLREVTTGNIARDLDQIRRALGERKMSYFGVSWGSWLGPVYRSLFPGKVGRMWVDSVAPPDPRLDEFEAGRTMATARNFSRMADWVARFDSTYGFGTTGEQVEAALAKLQAELEANPRQYDDIDIPIDGIAVAMASAEPSFGWPIMAEVLADVRDTPGPNAPESLKRLMGEPGGPPPPGTPAQFNETASKAIFCNGDGGARDFESGWEAYQDHVRRYPVTGVLSAYVSPCAGWPMPVERIRLRDTGGSLVLSGHRHESVSIYEWTGEMHEAVGGKVFTVEDDVHGSTFQVPNCSGNVLRYFDTGSAGADGCEGVPMPSGPEDADSEFESALERPFALSY